MRYQLSVYSTLEAGGGVLPFLMYCVRKCLTLPVALQYQIVPISIIVIIVPSSVIIITYHSQKDVYHLYLSKPFSHVVWIPFYFWYFRTSLSTSSFKRGVKLKVCINENHLNLWYLLSKFINLILWFLGFTSQVNSPLGGKKNKSKLATWEFGKYKLSKGCL